MLLSTLNLANPPHNMLKNSTMVAFNTCQKGFNVSRFHILEPSWLTIVLKKNF